MTLRNRVFALLLLLFLAVPASEASLLSRQYTSSWISPGFFPLGTSQIHISNIQNETGHEASFDILDYLIDQTYERLPAYGLKEGSFDDDNVVLVDINVYLYQEGSTFGRWLGGGAGAAYVVIHAIFRKRGQSIGAELLTVSVIGGGGLFSAGGEKTVLEDVATVVASFLKAGSEK